MAKYVVKFPEKIEANTIQEIMEATGWSRGTVYRILDGESRFPVTIEVNGKSKVQNKIKSTKAVEQAAPELPVGLPGNVKLYVVRG